MRQGKQTFDMQEAALNLKKRAQRRTAQRASLAAQAKKDFASIVELLIHKYGPKRIYQWGSLVEGVDFTEYSDIDIAVEGIKTAEDFFSMTGDAMKLTRFPLDIVELEKIEPQFAEDIIEKGKIVYERPT